MALLSKMISVMFDIHGNASSDGQRVNWQPMYLPFILRREGSVMQTSNIPCFSRIRVMLWVSLIVTVSTLFNGRAPEIVQLGEWIAFETLYIISEYP